MHIKRTIASILFTLIAVLGVFSIAKMAHAQYVYVKPIDSTSGYTAEEKTILDDAGTQLANATRSFNYIQGIYNRGDATTQKNIKPILDQADTLVKSARENHTNVFNALRSHDVTLAREKLSYLKYAADTLDGLTAKADTAVGKTRDQVISESQAADGKSCFNSVGIPTNIQICIRSVIGSVLYVILAMFAWLVELGGKTLDLVIQYSVVDIKSNIEGITAINTGWIIFRDIANLTFIFVLLYVAIGTILQTTNLQWRKLLVSIIIAAILINFSMFITKVLIDASNVITLVLYNGTIEVAKAAFPALATTDKANDLSNAFMSMLGIQGLYNANTVNQWAQSWEALATSAVGGIAVMFVAAFSFLSAAWLFIIRYVAIIFLIILSPLAFAARALPRLDKQWDRWKTTLISQMLFPIIYMLGIWLTVLIGSNMIKIGTATTSISQGFVSGASSSAINGVIRYIFIIIMLNATLLMAKSQATKAGGVVKDWMDKGTKKVDSWRARTKQVGKASAGYIAREGIPTRIPIPLTRNAKGERRQVVIGGFGKGAVALNKSLGNISGNTKIGKIIGNSRVGNYVRASTVGAVAGSKFATSKTAKDYADEGKKIATRNKELDNIQFLGTNAESTDPAVITTVGNAINKLSNSDVTKLPKEVLVGNAVIKNLSPGQYSAVMSSADISDSDKSAIKDARMNAIVEVLDPATANPDIARKMLNGMSGSDLAKLKPTVYQPPLVQNFIKYLNPSKLAQMEDLDQPNRHAIGTAIENQHTGAGGVPRVPHPAYGYIIDPSRAGLWKP